MQSEFEIIGREPTVYRYNIKIHGSCETFAQCGNIESETFEPFAQPGECSRKVATHSFGLEIRSKLELTRLIGLECGVIYNLLGRAGWKQGVIKTVLGQSAWEVE